MVLPVDCFCTVFKGGNTRAMAMWWATTSDIKSVEVRFLWRSVIWMEKMGRCLISQMWSLVLRTLASTEHTAAAKYAISISQALEKKMTTAMEQNPVIELSASFRDSNTCWDPFDYINRRPIWFQETCIGFSLQKKFFYIYIELRRWENISGNRPKLGILWGFSNIY